MKIFDNWVVFSLFVLDVNRRYVIETSGTNQVHHLDILSCLEVKQVIILNRAYDIVVNALSFQTFNVDSLRPFESLVLLSVYLFFNLLQLAHTDLFEFSRIFR
jgi:hypothetical protein